MQCTIARIESGEHDGNWAVYSCGLVVAICTTIERAREWIDYEQRQENKAEYDDNPNWNSSRGI